MQVNLIFSLYIVNQEKRIEKKIKKLEFGFSWITDGYEIENYLTLENINRAPGILLEENYEINSKKPLINSQSNAIQSLNHLPYYLDSGSL